MPTLYAPNCCCQFNVDNGHFKCHCHNQFIIGLRTLSSRRIPEWNKLRLCSNLLKRMYMLKQNLSTLSSSYFTLVKQDWTYSFTASMFKIQKVWKYGTQILNQKVQSNFLYQWRKGSKRIAWSKSVESRDRKGPHGANYLNQHSLDSFFNICQGWSRCFCLQISG